MRFGLVVLLLASLLSSCGYEGDGKFQTSGFWPLVNYSLELPDVRFESAGGGTFSLSGYKSHGRSLLSLMLSSPYPVAFHVLDAIVEVKIADGLGTTYFYRKGPLNRHYLRMVAEGESSYALETEWSCVHQYNDPSIDNRVISFDPDRLPSPQRSLQCWHFVPTGDRDLSLIVRIEDVPEELADMTLNVRITSGWK